MLIASRFPSILTGLLLAAAGTLPAVARADVLFDTFGVGNTFASSGAVISGANSGSTMFAEADRFTAPFSGSLSLLEVAVNLGSGVAAAAGFIDLALVPNNPVTNLPLAAGALTLGTVQATSTAPAILSLASFSSPYAFTAGNAYWLILAPHDAATLTFWEGATNPNATASAFMSETTGGQFQTNGAGAANAFRVSASLVAVPEPATTALMLLLGGAGLLPAVARRARRRGRREMDAAAGTVVP